MSLYRWSSNFVRNICDAVAELIIKIISSYRNLLKNTCYILNKIAYFSNHSLMKNANFQKDLYLVFFVENVVEKICKNT